MKGLDPWMDLYVRARSNAKPGWMESGLFVCLSFFFALNAMRIALHIDAGRGK